MLSYSLLYVCVRLAGKERESERAVQDLLFYVWIPYYGLVVCKIVNEQQKPYTNQCPLR